MFIGKIKFAETAPQLTGAFSCLNFNALTF